MYRKQKREEQIDRWRVIFFGLLYQRLIDLSLPCWHSRAVSWKNCTLGIFTDDWRLHWQLTGGFLLRAHRWRNSPAEKEVMPGWIWQAIIRKLLCASITQSLFGTRCLMAWGRKQSHLILTNSLQPHYLGGTRLLARYKCMSSYHLRHTECMSEVVERDRVVVLVHFIEEIL